MLDSKIKPFFTPCLSHTKGFSLFVFICLFLIDFIFKAVLRIQQNWVKGIGIFHILHGFSHAYLPPLSAFTTKVIFLLQLMKLCWHIIITESPQFTWGFTPGDVYLMDLDKYLTISVHDGMRHRSFSSC